MTQQKLAKLYFTREADTFKGMLWVLKRLNLLKNSNECSIFWKAYLNRFDKLPDPDVN